jgi:uncharacterized protein (DUF302 family)
MGGRGNTIPVAQVIATAAAGLVTVGSRFNAKETVDRLEAEIRAKGMTVFARVDHAAGAAAVSMPLRPTELLVFGNARGGTPLMQAEQTIGIDLPLKALVYEDASGNVWVAYNDPHWLAERHGVGSAAAVVAAMRAALEGVVGKVARSE